MGLCASTSRVDVSQEAILDITRLNVVTADLQTELEDIVSGRVELPTTPFAPKTIEGRQFMMEFEAKTKQVQSIETKAKM